MRVTETTDEWGCVKVKEVDMIWMNTWGILNRTNNMTRSCFSSFLYTCIVFTFFFILKKTQLQQQTNKEQNKYNKKKIYRNVEDKSLPIVFDYVLPIRQSTSFSFLFFFFFFFFFFPFPFVLKLYPYLVSFTIKGRELTRSLTFVLLLFFFFFYRRTKVSPLRL